VDLPAGDSPARPATDPRRIVGLSRGPTVQVEVVDMHEQSDGRKRLIAIVLIVIAVAGVWYFLARSGAREAVDETVDAFVPGPQEFERRMGYVDQARQLTDVINARQAQALDELE
jgi:hypothetical protein